MTRSLVLSPILTIMAEIRLPGVTMLTDFFGRQRRRQELARVYGYLLDSDDHMLRDIGVSRLDLMWMHAEQTR